MARTGKISWNKSIIKKLSKSKFIKQFETVYPDIDLEREYEKIVPKRKSKKAPEEG